MRCCAMRRPGRRAFAANASSTARRCRDSARRSSFLGPGFGQYRPIRPVAWRAPATPSQSRRRSLPFRPPTALQAASKRAARPLPQAAQDDDRPLRCRPPSLGQRTDDRSSATPAAATGRPPLRRRRWRSSMRSSAAGAAWPKHVIRMGERRIRNAQGERAAGQELRQISRQRGGLGARREAPIASPIELIKKANQTKAYIVFLNKQSSQAQ